METKILKGKALSEKILEEIKKEISELGFKLRLDIVLIGNDKSSELYVNLKKKKGEEIGVNVEVHRFAKIKTSELLQLIKELNENKEVTGYIIQMPIPKDSLEVDIELENLKDEEDERYWTAIKEILSAIDPIKDADGLSSGTLGMAFHDSYKAVLPATPEAVIVALQEIFRDEGLKKSLAGKNVTIINRSNIVGKPLAAALINLDATVTVAHSKTKNIEEVIKGADIVISGTGVPKFITGEMIKEGAVVIDVGINKTAEGVAGDVDKDSVIGKAGWLTPVPGGVGPLTVAMLFKNLLKLARLQISEK